jgi:energy-coupling factor transporter transmembrane protein EcfT
VAELTAFAYRSGRSRLHRLDARMKLILVAAASGIGLRLDFAALGLLALPLLAAAIVCRRGLRIQAGELRWIGLLVGFVTVARGLSADGTTVFAFMGVEITREGLREGALVGLRLAVVFLIGSVLMATTRSTEIKAGVQWYLKPLPFIAAERVGTMLGLLVRFIPLIFEDAAAASDAQRARAVEYRRNPLHRIVKLGVAIMSRILKRSDQLVLAMEARCYSEHRTPPALKAGLADWGMLALGCGWLAALWVFDTF